MDVKSPFSEFCHYKIVIGPYRITHEYGHNKYPHCGLADKTKCFPGFTELRGHVGTARCQYHQQVEERKDPPKERLEYELGHAISNPEIMQVFIDE